MSYRYTDVETKLGAFLACFTNRDHLHALCGVDVYTSGLVRQAPPLTVNGVEYWCRVDLVRKGDGEFALSDDPGINGRRFRSLGNHRAGGGLSDSARRQVERVVVPALQLWARSNPRLMYEAEAEACRVRIEYQGRRIAGRQREVDALVAVQRTCAIRLEEAEAALAFTDDELTHAVRTGAEEVQA